MNICRDCNVPSEGQAGSQVTKKEVRAIVDADVRKRGSTVEEGASSKTSDGRLEMVVQMSFRKEEKWKRMRN